MAPVRCMDKEGEIYLKGEKQIGGLFTILCSVYGVRVQGSSYPHPYPFPTLFLPSQYHTYIYPPHSLPPEVQAPSGKLRKDRLLAENSGKTGSWRKKLRRDMLLA